MSASELDQQLIRNARQNAYVIGVGMTRFGKHLGRSLNSLAREAIRQALDDAGIEARQLEAAWMGTGAAPVITGQVCIAGQAVLRGLGVGRIPVVNVENACATASTAFQQACTMVTHGLHDVVIAAGYEKLYHEDKARTFSVFDGCVDVDEQDAVLGFLQAGLRRSGAQVDLSQAGKDRSLFMDIYATWARDYLAMAGGEPRHLAMVTAKNSRHGALNPRAQFQDVLSVEQILAARKIADPLTLPMCSPIGDGAAAAVIVSERALKRLGARQPIRVAASMIVSGYDYADEHTPEVARWASELVYQAAGVGPRDLSLVELHDASSASELMYYESLGLCGRGEGVVLLESGATELGGRIPVSVSGGLNRKGHPIGATGLGQVFELVEQLRGNCGARQVQGASVGLAENGGGFIGADAAVMSMTVLTR
ncbi:Acetyl-CoA acetyltransferase [Pseudomonas citronellolis]|uniref:Acetyl-CoA acetyltransferase n=1 Tax=Pseudomonas citronellolis TaxID=53408 RepID=A0AAQ1HLI1_9PSED|nr:MULTISPECIES: thiolase family protein [Pseudomonas]MED5607889.1 thiolase family protein [Pseudomonas sp. JH-2]TGC32069.1 thiolase family protein [Pseudomonas citronellolis]UUC52859.1 thiolase family protein [Pseudomonas citronellolis]SFC62217.1 Acetyl-CoA acetyltransferase [Pseudomonas citronellolis]